MNPGQYRPDYLRDIRDQTDHTSSRDRHFQKPRKTLLKHLLRKIFTIVRRVTRLSFEVAVNILQGLGDENPYQRPIAIHPTPLAAKLKAPFETDSPLTPLPSDYQSPEANYAKSQTARDPTEPDLEPWGQPRASYTFGESSAAGLQEPPAYSWGEASEQQREREERIQRYLQSQIIEPQEPSVKEEVRSDISYLTQQEYPPLPSSPRPDLRGL